MAVEVLGGDLEKRMVILCRL